MKDRTLHTPGTLYRSDVMLTHPFSLSVSAAPAAWGGDRSPRYAVRAKGLTVVEAGSNGVIWTQVQQDVPDRIRLRSNAPEGAEEAWLHRVFRQHDAALAWTDPVISRLAAALPGLHPLTDGSLFLGLVTSIIGQSISIASAMAAQRRLGALFSDGIEVEGRHLVPLPDASVLADASAELIRSSGVTWKRAEALKAIASAAAAGELPVPGSMADDELERSLRELPLVGPWTAASALLWGIGAPDAFPTGDVALLRAARLAYDDAGMTMKELAQLADGWRPCRGIATRLLWTHLLGVAWDDEEHDDPTDEHHGAANAGGEGDIPGPQGSRRSQR